MLVNSEAIDLVLLIVLINEAIDLVQTDCAR